MLLLRMQGAAYLESERRRATGEWLMSALPYARSVERIHPPGDAVAGWLRFPLLLAEGWEGFDDPRAASRAGLAPGYPRILPELPAVRARMTERSRDEDWPGARLLVRQLVTLPTHSWLTAADHARLLRIVEHYARRERGVMAS